MYDLHLAYQETAHLHELLAEWDAGVVAEGPIVRNRWADIALWPAARSGTIAGSTGIEGNPLTASQVDEVLAGGPVAARPTDVREVLNYNAALDLANRAALRTDFEWTQELLRRLNATAMQGLEDDERGEYRHQAVNVGGVFSPPDYSRVPSLMSRLVEWLRGEDCGHPIIRGGLTHLNVVSIHPWLNGNGRTARVAGSLMLMRCGIGAPELLNVESAIRASAERYAYVLQATHGSTYDPERHSATEWLEYFAGICVSQLEARNRLNAAVRNDVGLLAQELHGAQMSPDWPFILLGASLAPVRTARLAESLGLSAVRVRAILQSMVAAGWLVAEGDNRARRYAAGSRLRGLPLRTPELMYRLRNEAAPSVQAPGPGEAEGDRRQ